MNTTLKKIIFSLATIAAFPAMSQTYPDKPIKVIIGFAAGGPTDVIARVLAQDMTATLGQSVIVENKAGANAKIATEYVAQAPADGYTLLFASLSHNVNAIMFKKPGYDPITSFEPISMVADLPMILVTSYNSPVKTLPDFIKLAKEKPGTVSYSSSGNAGSSHLAGSLLATDAKVDLIHVPFKGNGPALTEVMAGNVNFIFYPIIGIADQVAQKRLIPLAVGTTKRHPDFPNTSTMEELGFKGFDATAPWVGMLAPAGTPAIAVQKIDAAIQSALAKPEIRKRLNDLGAVIVGSRPNEFKAFLVKDKLHWKKVIDASGLKPE
jgi:tripartite-type tricarboxylate transporter receptor subunit TctC